MISAILLCLPKWLRQCPQCHVTDTEKFFSDVNKFLSAKNRFTGQRTSLTLHKNVNVHIQSYKKEATPCK